MMGDKETGGYALDDFRTDPLGPLKGRGRHETPHDADAGNKSSLNRTDLCSNQYLREEEDQNENVTN